MDKIFKIFALLLFLLTTSPNISAKDIFENSTTICQRCNCYLDGSEYFMECKNRKLEHSLANWPPHNTTLLATFSYNNISTLERLPASEFVLQLVFDHCGIKSLEDGLFENVKNVEYVDLSYNELTTEEIAPTKFKGPYNKKVYEPIAIKNLNLAYNKIHSLPHKLFEHMDLEELNLEGNQFRVLDGPTQVALCTLTKLQRLNLANNALTELVGDSITNLGQLVELNLGFNSLDFVPDTLSLIGSHLEILNLDNNLIFELTNESFLGVTGLMELSLNGLDRLKYVNANAFSPLVNLKVLSLANNKNLKLIDKDAFAQNVALEELSINNNSLNHLDYSLIKWSTLRVLTLENNEFVCDCDLLNISKVLNEEITKTLDGPICLDSATDTMLQIYRLNIDVCTEKQNPFAMKHVTHHFETIRITLLTVTIVFTITTFLAVTVAFLRYRRNRMNRNYPFVSQVLYNPINSQPFA